MAALIDDLLHLSRVARADMNLGRVDLSAEARSWTAGAGSRTRPTGPLRHPGGCLGDRRSRLIRTVLQNLIENAWKFTARRNDALIEFGASAPDGADLLLCA